MVVMTRGPSDDRLDHLDLRVDEGFERMGSEFTRIDKRVDEGFARMDREFARVDKRFDRVEEAIVTLSAGIDSLRNVLLIGTLGLLGTVIAAAGAIVAAQ
jgi:hypothetical protein